MSKTEKLLFKGKSLLEKFPGKGGWTFAMLPGIITDKKQPFGWRKVCGFIDDFEIRKYHLMSMGQGRLFLPVNAQIRKAIGKKEGDTVTILLYPDNEPLEIPEEWLMCLLEDKVALHFFNSITESEQNHYIKWIYSSKKEETKINRMANAMNRLARRLKLYDIEK
jgi:hypothetical protein